MSDNSNTRRIGHYAMLETLGAGGFSKVKLGIDDQTGERVALKILKKDKLSSNSTILKQVQRELAAMSKIKHENVITLKDINWDATYVKKDGTKMDVILVVLELATGRELFDFLAFTGNFDESIARTYFHQLINGVGYSHSLSIVHRDLKPENLLLSSDFTLKIADFGFANAFTENERLMYTECGTPGYMAPEVFTRSGYDGCGADVWSCGVILFIMLAGFPPFQKPAMNDWWFNKLATNRQHLFWEAHCRSATFSADVKDFLNKVLQPEAAKRMKISEMIKHPWFQGPTIGSAALATEFQKRKQTVDENKMREKLEKKKAAEATGGELQEDGDMAMMRGHGDPEINPDTENLPNSHPQMNLTVLQAPGKGGNLDNGNINFDSDPASTVNTASNNTSTGTSSTVCNPPLYPSSSPFTFTEFTSTSSPSTLYSRISSALEANKFQYEGRESEGRFKASLLTPVGQIQLSIQLYQGCLNGGDQKDNQVYTVNFKKMNGDASQFRLLYADLKLQLADLIATPGKSVTGITQQLANQTI